MKLVKKDQIKNILRVKKEKITITMIFISAKNLLQKE